MSEALERRLQALEDAEAIRALKARYFAACDAKDPAAMRACFADAPVAIDYGRVGQFDDPAALVELFRNLACHEHVVELHHGVNPQIEVLDATRARGRWGLHYQMINTSDSTLTQLSGAYEDEYRRTPSGWKISATRFTVTSTLVLALDAVAMRTLFSGRSPPVAVEEPNRQAG